MREVYERKSKIEGRRTGCFLRQKQRQIEAGGVIEQQPPNRNDRSTPHPSFERAS